MGHTTAEGSVVLDATREVQPPFSPEAVTADFAAVLHAYGVSTVIGDRFGDEFQRDAFRAHGIDYILCETPKSELYRELLPLVNSRRVELLDVPRLRAQLVGLERRTGRGGQDSIDHRPSAHDDLANSCAGVIAHASRQARPRLLCWSGYGETGPNETFEQMVTRRRNYFPGDYY